MVVMAPWVAGLCKVAGHIVSAAGTQKERNDGTVLTFCILFRPGLNLLHLEQMF